MDLTDEALVTNFRQTQDQAYLKSLIRRYEHRLYNTALQILDDADGAEEVVQDTCVKLLQNLPRFRVRSSFASWIFRIAYNTCLDRLRAKRRRQIFGFFSFDPKSISYEDIEEPFTSVRQVADTGIGPQDKLDLSEQGEIIAASLKQLPKRMRVVVVLHDIEGLTYDEIAEIIGANSGTVRSRLHYGRTKLKELLEPYFDQHDPTPASR